MPIALFFKSNEEEVIKYFSFLFKQDSIHLCFEKIFLRVLTFNARHVVHIDLRQTRLR